MKIPPEVQIRATIRTGSVFYFVEETITSSSQPHFFIVLNVDPSTDETIVLVCSSSRIRKVKRRRWNCPSETLVQITPAEYPDFKVTSIVDCNTVLQKDISELVQKLSQGQLRLKERMAASVRKKLRHGVLASPTVERRIKALLGS